MPRNFRAGKNLKQFRTKNEWGGGVETFFEKRRKYYIDLIVNTTIAFLYMMAPTEETTKYYGLYHIMDYINRETSKLLKNMKISRYYPNGTYFAERIAKLAFYDPTLLNKESEESLDKFLLIAVPKNALDASLLSIGSSCRGLKSRVKALNREIEKKRKSNGTWPFGTSYSQGTPRYNYGCERLTTLFSIEALELESSGPKRINLN